jgi:hypothetical protein
MYLHVSLLFMFASWLLKWQNVKPWEVANTIWLLNVWKRDIISRFSVLSCTTFYELLFSVAKDSVM